MSDTATRYPLTWPAGWKRTARAQRKRAPFATRKASAPGSYPQLKDLTIAQALDRLQSELDRLGARDLILSTNVRTRLDGLPYSNDREPEDPGAAVYFSLSKKPRCLACDAFLTVAGNIAALAGHIEAIRRIDRYGVGTIEQAFAGYAALPAPAADWRTIFDFDGTPTLEMVEHRYRRMAERAHPDKGGTDEEMARLNVAIESARAELGELVTR